MNNLLKKNLQNRLGIDKELLKSGKWIKFGNNGIELLCRPATIHNKDFQRKILENKKVQMTDILTNPEKAEDTEVQMAFAECLHETVILDIRVEGLSREETGSIESAEDIHYLMTEFQEYFRILVIKLINRETFAVIEESDEKN